MGFASSPGGMSPEGLRGELLREMTVPSVAHRLFQEIERLEVIMLFTDIWIFLKPFVYRNL